jgi:HK97 family phage prohead protease
MAKILTRRDTRNMPQQLRQAQVKPGTFNESDNTIEVVMSAGARIERMDWWEDKRYEEELEISASAINMERVEAGTMQVLDNHRSHGGVDSILGRVLDAWIEDDELIGRLQLTDREDKAGVVADIRSGVIRALSIGYSVQGYQITEAKMREDGGTVDLWRAAKWTPMEVSFVTVPADPTARTRGADPQTPMAPCEFFTRATGTKPEESTMDDDLKTPVAQPADAAAQQPAAPAVRHAPEPAPMDDVATRAAEIADLCARHNVPHMTAELIRGGADVARAKDAILNAIAVRDAASGGHHNTRIETVRDGAETRLRGIEEALLARVDASVQLTDNGRQFRGLSLLEIGRELMEANGQSTRGLARLELATRMLKVRSGPGYMGTTDFGGLLANVANKRLSAAYQNSPITYRVWARRAPNAPDFKDISVVQLSGAPELLRTNEHGEFTYGTLSDNAENYSVVTYGRIVALTRQAIINDDLRGFDRLVSAFGNSAARLENRLVYSQLTDNADMGDGRALFDNTYHFNDAGTSSQTLTLANLGAARGNMRKQKGLQGEVLNIAPSFLIVPAALEQTAYQLTSTQYVPVDPQYINEFRPGGRTAVTAVIDPILDVDNAGAWYLAADPNAIDTVEYCYLDGAEGPVIETEQGFEVDGVSMKARLDFAAKATDWRGLYRANKA